MVDLSSTVFGLGFANPIVVSSGPAGFGDIFAETVDASNVGAFTFKTVTKHGREGNRPPRLVDCGYGMIASIGLQNPGIEEFISNVLSSTRLKSTRLIVSIAAFCIEDFSYISSLLEDLDGFDILELNLSCPNVDKADRDPSEDPDFAHSVVAAVKSRFRSRPVIAKLSPHSEPLSAFTDSCEKGGIDGFTLFNAYHGARFDIDTGKPFLKRIEGAYSSPALKPLTLKKVHDARQHTDKPIIACGGASSAEDILEFIAAGSNLVGFGLFGAIDPKGLVELPLQLERLLIRRGFTSLSDYARYVAKTG